VSCAGRASTGVDVSSGTVRARPLPSNTDRRFMADSFGDSVQSSNADPGVGEQCQPFTPEPTSVETKCRWKAMNSPTAGAASTQAPARIAPNGFVARDDTLLM